MLPSIPYLPYAVFIVFNSMSNFTPAIILLALYGHSFAGLWFLPRPFVLAEFASGERCHVPKGSATNYSARFLKRLAVSLTRTRGTPMAVHQRRSVSPEIVAVHAASGSSITWPLILVCSANGGEILGRLSAHPLGSSLAMQHPRHVGSESEKTIQ